jgi:hypothetical protein
LHSFTSWHLACDAWPLRKQAHVVILIGCFAIHPNPEHAFLLPNNYQYFHDRSTSCHTSDSFGHVSLPRVPTKTHVHDGLNLHNDSTKLVIPLLDAIHTSALPHLLTSFRFLHVSTTLIKLGLLPSPSTGLSLDIFNIFHALPCQFRELANKAGNHSGSLILKAGEQPTSTYLD